MKSVENNIVQYINSKFARSNKQLNKSYECDCELVKINSDIYAFNIDDYSFEEDYFSDNPPENLGYNLVIATISDLLACGATPEFFMHSITLQNGKDETYTRKFLNGINEALKITNTFLIGGDISTADDWKYTGVAFGKSRKPIMRTGAQVGDIIYSTGKFGAGNRQGLLLHLQKYPETSSPRFISRYEESKFINKYARFAIDSSDGYINSFFNLNLVNPDINFCVDIHDQLLDPISHDLSVKLALPTELFLFATLGEYELIFGIPKEKEDEFLNNSGAHDFIKVGKVQNGSGISISKNNKIFPLKEQAPDPRALDINNYLIKLREYIEKALHE